MGLEKLLLESAKRMSFHDEFVKGNTAMDTRPKKSTAEAHDGTASARVMDALREEILGGQLLPGTRIRQEELALRFETSRIPVREALSRLESEGLVSLRANTGAWVSKIDAAEFIETYKIRERVETLAIRDSVARLSEQQIEAIEKQREIVETSVSVEDFLRHDRAFHLMTYAGVQSKTLHSMIDRFWNTTQHYRREFARRADGTSTWIVHAEHRLLVEALKRRDSDDAERILLGHIRRTRKELGEGLSEVKEK